MEFLKELDYQVWAEKKFFNLISSIDESKWTKEISESNKSLKSVYIHKLEVMWFWFSLCKVKDLRKLGEPPNFESMSKENLIKQYLFLFLEMKDYAENCNEKMSLNLNWVKKPYETTTHEIIYNVLNHHTYHRGQIAMLLKQLGLDVPETDYNPYMFELNELYE